MQQGEERVIFRRNVSQLGRVCLMGEGQVRVAVHQPRDDRVPGDVDALRRGRIPRKLRAHCRDAVSL